MSTNIFHPTFKPYPIDPYYTIVCKPINREQKRKFTFETNKVIEVLFEIDAAFITDIFVKGRDYQEAFTDRNTSYKKMVEYLNKVNKWQYIKLPDDYFYNEYRPIETIK